MLIKPADDKSKRLQLLESLLDSPVLTVEQKKFANNEFWALQQGIKGERDAAHYLDNHFASDTNLAVIHDLRLVVDGEVAQIDHLLISRGFVFYLLETKHFNGNLSINEYGEFSVSYAAGKVLGVPSPLEQSRRHQNVLVKLLSQLGISGRSQKEPEFRHVVLVNPKATITRPEAKVFDTTSVIKADQFASWREKYVHNEMGVLQTFGALLNLRNAETVQTWAKQLCAEHRPLDLLVLPEQLKPTFSVQNVSQVKQVKQVGCAQCRRSLTDAEQAFCQAKSVWFDGRLLCREHQDIYRKAKEVPLPVAPKQQKQPIPLEVQSDEKELLKRKLICCSCGVKITFPEGKFCWANERRFKGFQYCRDHQSDIR